MTCDCSRRDFLRIGSGSLLAMLFSGRLAAQDAVQKAKACIFLFLYGGPSHLDTWDPKPGSQYGGEFKPIRTDAGFEICEHLPRLAKVSKRLAVVRSMTSPEVDHGRGAYYLRTGFRPAESVEHPSLGAIFGKELAKDDSDIPPYVSIAPADELVHSAGYLGDQYAPFIIDTPGEVPSTLSRSESIPEERLAKRLKLLRKFEEESQFEEESRAARLLHDKAARYMKGPLGKSLNLALEKDSVRDGYGTREGERTAFGQACLTARRLIESGVRFVEITMSGWDTHEDNFNVTRGLCGELDAGMSTLIRELDSRGLLDSTLVVCGGEFGRTPEINEQAGRDHFGDVFSLVLAGGGVRGDQVVGSSDADGMQVGERPVTFPDLMASIANLTGIDPDKEYYTPEGRPIKIVDGGTPVRGLGGGT